MRNAICSLAVTVSLLTPGCLVDLSVPAGANLSCTEPSDCPPGTACRQGRCLPEGNAAPSVLVLPVERSVDVVHIDVAASDADGDELELAFTLLEPDEPPRAIGTLTASGLDDELRFEWPAAATFGDSRLRHDLRVEVVATDAAGATATATSDPFTFGNDAPALTGVTVDLGPRGSITGLAILRFTVGDSTGDPVDVAGLAIAGDAAFSEPIDEVDVADAATFPAGGDRGLLSRDPAGGEGPVTHAVVWDSAAAFAIDRSPVYLRLVVADPFAPGLPQVVGPFAIDNATSAPELHIDSAPTGRVSGDVEIAYTITDADGDACLVIVEYTEDGLDWTLAASESDTVGLLPGPHVFTWESTQLGFAEFLGVQLRLTVSDPVYEAEPTYTGAFDVDNSDVAGNSAPAATIGAIGPPGGGRFVGIVRVPFVLSDPNADPVSITVAYGVDPAGPWYVATPLGDTRPAQCGNGTVCSSAALAGLTATTTGESYVFEWDALHDASVGGRALAYVPLTLVDPDPSDGIAAEAELTPTAMVDATASVYVRIVPTDAPPDGLAAKVGLAALSTPFPLGNRPPALTLGPGTTGLGLAARSGEVPIDFILTDGSADLGAVEIEYSIDDGVTFVPVSVALGSLTELASLPTGKTHVVVWDSLADLGTRIASVQLRLRAYDLPDLATAHVTSWVTTDPFEVRNQSPPRVEALFVKSDGALRSGRVPIHYRIIDAEADPTDVHFEFSPATGTPWARCSEYPEPRSEGTQDLASAPDGDTSGANEHLFVWDAGSDLFIESFSVSVRVTAADENPGATTVVLQPGAVGPPSVSPNDFPFATTYYNGDPANDTVIADLDGDGAVDMVNLQEYAGPEGSWVHVWRGGLSLGVPTGTFTFATTIDFPGIVSGLGYTTALAVADLDADGHLDVIVGDVDGAVSIRLGTADPATFAAPVAAPALPAGMMIHDLVTGFWDADAQLDVAVLALDATDQTHLYTYAGNDLPTLLAAPVEWPGALGTIPPGSIFKGHLVARDHDGDGDVDLVSPTRDDATACVSTNTSGAFSACSPIGSSSPTFAIAFGDIDGDGIDDLVSNILGRVSVELADPTAPGTYLAATSVYTPGSIKVGLGDFNGDGLADALAIDRLVQPYLLLAGRENGRGTGRLVAPVSVAPAYTDTIVVGDVNGDAVPDAVLNGQTVVTTGATGRLGPGSLAPRITSAPYCGIILTTRLAVDLTADGLTDMLTTCSYSWLPHNFDVRASVSPLAAFADRGSLSYGGVRADVADVDGDGLLDVVSADPLGVAYGTGTPGALAFEDLAEIFPGSLNEHYPDAIAVGDFTGDGRLDVAVTGVDPTLNTSELRIYAQTVTGPWRLAGTLSGPEATDIESLAAGDFNGDGVLDLAGGTGGGSGLDHFDFTFLSVTPRPGDPVLTTTVLPSPLVDVLTCDVNGDGILDLVGQSFVSGELGVAFGNGVAGKGDGTFDLDPANVRTLIAQSVQATHCLDVNGDGWQDVVGTLDMPPWELIVIASDGYGGMQPALPYTDTDPWGGPTLALDANGDGVFDLAAGDAAGKLHVRTGVLESFRYGWARALEPWSEATPRRNVLGSVLLAEERDFGPAIGTVALIQPLGGRYYHGEGDQGAASAAHGTAPAPSFKDLVMRFTTPTPQGDLRPVTAPWRYTGDVRLLRGHDPALGGAPDTGSRLRVAHRYGPRGADGHPIGLSTAGPFAGQRAIIVDLPLRNDTAVFGTDKLRVFARHDDWLRASELTEDPMHAAAGASDYLPRVFDPDTGTYRDVVVIRHTYRAIPPATSVTGVPDFTADSGPRFFFQGNTVRVVTAELGVFQAFIAP